MVGLHRIEVEDRTRNEMRGVKFEVSGCKKSLEKLLESVNAPESRFTELRIEGSYLKNEIDNLN